MLQEQLATLLPQGRPPRSQEEEEALYASAYALYEGGKYKEATEIFTQLVLSSPFSERSWRGLAAAQQQGEQFEAALHAWALVALLESEDPLPHFHAAECLFYLQQREEMLKALGEAEKRLSEKSSFLRGKIDLLKMSLT